MRRELAMLLLMGMAAATHAQSTQPAAAATAPAAVPVKVVVLYSSGVGYFEHFGTVHGEATTELRFKTAQVNDILKSLLLEDLDGGTVSTVTYPSQDPLGKVLKSFQVDITANPSLAELLNQLRGAQVKVVAKGEEAQGTILSVEKQPRAAAAADKGPIEVPVLNLLAGGTIRSVELSQVSRLELLDPQLQQELAKALAALAQARDQDTKPVRLGFAGRGERRVRVGYVVETPVWKTSYRLVLPPAGGGEAKPKLVGWAIVENQTDNDWAGVQLSLVSGRPISFIQDLYQPLYVPRPVVQPELYASLRPQTYEGGMETDKLAQTGEFKANQEKGKALEQAEREQLRRGGLAAASPPAPTGAPAGIGGGGARDAAAGRALDPTASIASAASAAKLGELFQYTVGNVSLPRQRSAMIPILTDDVEVERLSIYNQAVLARHPLNGARVKNTTAKHLLQGPVTVLDANAYAGDARIDNVPPGQERLLSYGIDLQVVVDATKNTSTSAIVAGKIVKGVLLLSRRHVFSQDYLADNNAEKDKTLVIEHPVRPGWKLLEPADPMETTEQVYRFKGTVPAGKATKLTVKQEVVQGERVEILPADPGTLAVYARSGEIDQVVRDVLAKAIAMKQALAESTRQRVQREQQVGQITAEQQRIRENMKTVAQNSEYYQRLLAKLNEQETKIETLQKEIEQYRGQEQKQQQDLDAYLMSIDTTAPTTTTQKAP